MLKISWYLKRIKVMGFKEILYRIYEQVHIVIYLIQYRLGVGISSDIDFSGKKFRFIESNSSCLPALTWKTISELEKKKIIEGVFELSDGEWLWNDNDNIWFQSSKSKVLWPRAFFNSIDYRQGNIYGDVRVSWEPARLQQLVDAALLLNTVDAESSKKLISLIEEQLDSWVKLNPPLCGIHYISSMECALRIMAVCISIDMVRNDLHKPEQSWSNLLSLVWSHALFIEKRISLYSSAGNHTVAECAGLIFAGVLFPEFKEAKRWKETGERIFFDEIKRQIYPDGGGLEQTLWYHVFVLDLLGLVIKLYEHYAIKIDDEIVILYNKGRQFLNTFSLSLEELPNIGDSDSGYALSKYLNIIWTECLCNEGLTTFNESGYSVFNKSETHQHLVFDHGTLGMAPSYGHGHADALSVILRYGNDDVLIDPGTYTYTGDPEWRKYFRSSRAHNTVVINGLDQSRQESSFSWSKPYVSKLIEIDQATGDIVRLLAYHDGYKELGIRHWRGVIIFPTGCIAVWDYVDGIGEFDIELNWHLGVQVKKIGKVFYATNSTDHVGLQIDGGEVHVHHGEMTPILGWQSTKYGVKIPIMTLSATIHNTLPMSFVTKISVDNLEINDDVLSEEISLLEGCIL